MHPFPNPESVTIHPSKLRRYLLSLSSRDGWGKAKWFRKIGFDESNVDLMAKALCRMPIDSPLVEIVPSPPFGTKYVVEGPLNGPNGGGIVRSVWQVDTGETIPRLITAYPIVDEEREDD